MDMKIFRTGSALELSVWPAKRKCLLEIAPAFPDKPKGQPAPGSKLYDYNKKIKISFNTLDMLTFAYALHKHANGQPEEFKKMADMSKAKFEGNTDTDKKSLSVNLNQSGGVGFFLSKGDQKLSIILNKSDAFSIAKWLEATFMCFYLKSTEGGADVEEGTED